jgi:hypothetical protein
MREEPQSNDSRSNGAILLNVGENRCKMKVEGKKESAKRKTT